MEGNKEMVVFTKKMSTSSEEGNIIISRSPSRLLFDEDDSSSDHSSGSGPKRRCSFVSSDRPNIMDLRYPDSVHGGRSYDLSVCSGSGNSLNTSQTDDALEKMGMFEIALSAGFKKKDDNGVLIRANTYPKEAKPVKEGLLHKMRMKRYILDHGGLFRHTPVLPTGDDDDSSVVKKSKTSRKKAYIRRCAQAAVIIFFLSALIASVIFFETSNTDPSSLIVSLSAGVSSMMENTFGSSSGQEVEEVQPQPQQKEVKRREEERMMAQQQQMMIIQEDPPVDNPEYDRFFVQSFRNNQKISQRLNNDPMRQRMMIHRENKVDHSMDEVAQVRIQVFRDNQRLALEREDAGGLRKK